MTCALIPLTIATARFLPQTGSEWAELAVHIGTRWPERWIRFRPLEWEGSGAMVRSLAEAQQRHERLVRFARSMTAEQREALWQDPSAEAAELRRVMR